MTILNLNELIQALPVGQRLLGIDPGQKQIGLALSDVSRMLASPYAVIKRGKVSAFVKELQNIIQKENIGGLVCGLPLSLDGSFGPAAQAARDWINVVSQASQLPAALWDERLSSSAVNRFLIEEADVSRKRRGELVDKMAACYMLQAALDAAKV